MSHRIDQVNSLIQQQVSDILFSKIDREHFKLLTITRVVTSRDLSLAKIYVSLPSNDFASFQQWVKPQLYHIQGELNHRLSLYKAPRIMFVEDKTGAYVDRIESLIRQIQK